jgi:hypothetical protein
MCPTQALGRKVASIRRVMTAVAPGDDPRASERLPRRLPPSPAWDCTAARALGMIWFLRSEIKLPVVDWMKIMIPYRPERKGKNNLLKIRRMKIMFCKENNITLQKKKKNLYVSRVVFPRRIFRSIQIVLGRIRVGFIRKNFSTASRNHVAVSNINFFSFYLFVFFSLGDFFLIFSVGNRACFAATSLVERIAPSTLGEIK